MRAIMPGLSKRFVDLLQGMEIMVSPPQESSGRSSDLPWAIPAAPIRVSNWSSAFGIYGLAFAVGPLLLICGLVFAWELSFSEEAVRLGGGADRFIFPGILVFVVSTLELVLLRTAARTPRAIEFSQVITLVFPFHHKVYPWDDLRQIKARPIRMAFF